MSAWQAWVGREEQRADRVDPGLLSRWLATLDRAPPKGQQVPQGLHWCLCPPDAPTADLGADGHPRRTDGLASFLPPVPLPRRMWAASAVEFIQPLTAGEDVARRSVVQSVTEKQGASGALVFVDVAHETFGQSGLAVRERQSLVYRAAPDADAPAVPPSCGNAAFDRGPWTAHRTVSPSESLLFRYSALTFNSHRIHYDAPYARSAENYRGLVVHGPLTATLLLDLARRELGDNMLKSFAFRGISPAICGEEMNLVMRKAEQGFELGAFAADGRQIMSGVAA